MSLYLCLDCNSVYDSRYTHLMKDRSGDLFCPKLECNGVPFNVDELMIEPLKLLNHKNYYTEYSCSCHVYSHNILGGYIKFEKGCAPDSLPEDWYIDEDKINMRYKVEGDPYTPERIDSISKHMGSLVKWASELPIKKEL